MNRETVIDGSQGKNIFRNICLGENLVYNPNPPG